VGDRFCRVDWIFLVYPQSNLILDTNYVRVLKVKHAPASRKSPRSGFGEQTSRILEFKPKGLDFNFLIKRLFIGRLQFVMSDIDRRWRKQPTHMHHTQDRQSDKRIFYSLRQKYSRLG
jgi:hypothetical protein